jgi:hypothetical protein
MVLVRPPTTSEREELVLKETCESEDVVSYETRESMESREEEDSTCPLNGDVVLDDVRGVLLSSSDHLSS